MDGFHTGRNVTTQFKRIFSCAALVLTAFCLSVPPVWADGNGIWAQVPGAERLKAAHKEVLTEVFAKANCYAGCPDTIANCLKDAPEEPAVRRLAGFAVRRALKGGTVESILQDIKNRALSAYPPKTVKPDISGIPASGNPKAKVRVVAYSDFECPYCNVALPALRKITRKNPDFAVLYFKNFPIKSHKSAIPSSTAVVAADKQGKFWEMHDCLYAKTELAESDILDCAQKVGLDLKTFETDRKAKDTLNRIRKEKKEGISFDVIGTPGLFVNGKFYVGPKNYDDLLDRLEEERDIVEGRQ